MCVACALWKTQAYRAYRAYWAYQTSRGLLGALGALLRGNMIALYCRIDLAWELW